MPAWLLRYSMGLPARKQDVDAMLRDIPELFGPSQNGAVGHMPAAAPPRPRHWSVWNDLFHDWAWHLESPDGLAAWASSREQSDGILDSHIRPTRPLTDCPANQCPLKVSGSATFGSESGTSSDPLLARLMTMPSMGPARSTKSFMNLVSQVHKGQAPPTQIFVTDRYIAVGAEEGAPPPTAEFKQYLTTLGVTKSSPLTVTLWNTRFDGNISGWQTQVKAAFPHTSFVRRRDTRFHDRFYLATPSSSTDLRGVFGPSLNGLRGAPVFVMGELESSALEWFRERLDKRAGKRGR